MCFCELTCKERTFLRWCLLCHYIDKVFTTLLYSIFFSWQTPSARGHEKYNFQRFWWRYEHWCCHSGKIPKICTQTSNSRSTRKSNDESIKIQLILALVIVIMNNTNRTEWSPIRSVIIRVIYKIRRPRSGSPICQSQVWLQTELDDTKSCYQLIITITIFGKKKHWGETSPVETMSKAKNLEISQFTFQVVVMVIVIDSVIGGFSWVNLVWLAASTVRLQVSDYSQLSDYNCTGWFVKYKAADVPIHLRELWWLWLR